MNEDSQVKSESQAIYRLFITLAVVSLLAQFYLTFRSSQPTWSDETFTIRVSTQSWDGFAREVKNDVHPPLYFALAKLATTEPPAVQKYLKWSPPGIRLLSYNIHFFLLISIISLWKKRSPNYISFIIGAGLIISSAHLWLFGPMLRYYGLASLGAVISTLVLLPNNNSAESIRKITAFERWVYAIFLLTAFYSSYLTAVLIPAHIFLISKLSQTQKKGYIIALIIVLLVSLPLLFLLYQQSMNISSNNFSIIGILIGTLSRFLFSLYSFSFGEFLPPWNLILFLPAILSVLVLILWGFKNTKADCPEYIRNAFLLSLIFGTVILSMLNIGLEFSPSRLMFLCPLWLLWLSANIKSEFEKIKIVASVVLILVNLISSYNFHQRQGYLQSTYITPWDKIADDILDAHGEIWMEAPEIIYDDETLPYYLRCRRDNRVNYDIAWPYFGAPGNRLSNADFYIVYSPRTLDLHPDLAADLEQFESENRQYMEYRYLVEDANSMRFKSMLLRRQIEPVKKILRIYRGLEKQDEESESDTGAVTGARGNPNGDNPAPD